MRVILALLAVAVSVAVIGFIALRDPKRLRVHHGEAANQMALSARQRQLLTLIAVMPGLLLTLTGWWSAAVMWVGATVTLLWLFSLLLSRRPSSG